MIFNYTGSPEEIIPQKVLGGYFFDSHCISAWAMLVRSGAASIWYGHQLHPIASEIGKTNTVGFFSVEFMYDVVDQVASPLWRLTSWSRLRSLVDCNSLLERLWVSYNIWRSQNATTLRRRMTDRCTVYITAQKDTPSLQPPFDRVRRKVSHCQAQQNADCCTLWVRSMSGWCLYSRQVLIQTSTEGRRRHDANIIIIIHV